MKARPITHAMCALLLMLWAAPATAQSIELYFSPNGGAANAIAKEIAAAKTTIRIQAYSISEDQITAALIAAKTRGVNIALIVNPTQQNDAYSTAGKLKKAGIPTVVDRAHALQHNKTIIIDSAITITGSMNFTAAGDKKNAENTLIIRDEPIAARYTADWTLHRDHSTTFTPKHHADYTPPPTPPNLILSPKPAHAQEP